MARILNTYLNDLYLDPARPSSFSSIEKVYRQARKDGKNVTRDQVKQFLQGVRSYTVHRPAPSRFPRRKVTTAGINDLIQIDLVDLQSLAAYNDGYRYLFVAIDVFSKRLWAFPIRDKTQTSTIQAMQAVLDTLPSPPARVEQDRGREFGLRFKRFLEGYGIIWSHATNATLKCQTVERVNRSLKGRLFRYFSYARSWRYLEVLPALVDSYNHTYHSTLQMAPVDVTPQNEAKVWWRRFGSTVHGSDPRPLFRVGDTVRIRIRKATFTKGYEPTFSEATYRIYKVIASRPVTYRLEDSLGNRFNQVFYAQDLSLFTEPSGIWYIDRIIRTRKSGRNKELLVRWLGYSPLHDQWIKESDLLHAYKA